MNKYDEYCRELSEINRKIAILMKRKKELTKLKDAYLYDELIIEKFDNFYNDEYLLVRIAKGSDIFGGFC